MSEHYIDIRTNGIIHCLYTDLIDLQALGRLHVERASDVEFNGETQEWEARLPDGRIIATHPSRSECLRKEVEYLQERLSPCS